MATQQQIIREVFQLVSKRSDHVCNFLEGNTYVARAGMQGGTLEPCSSATPLIRPCCMLTNAGCLEEAMHA